MVCNILDYQYRSWLQTLTAAARIGKSTTEVLWRWLFTMSKCLEQGNCRTTRDDWYWHEVPWRRRTSCSYSWLANRGKHVWLVVETFDKWVWSNQRARDLDSFEKIFNFCFPINDKSFVDSRGAKNYLMTYAFFLSATKAIPIAIQAILTDPQPKLYSSQSKLPFKKPHHNAIICNNSIMLQLYGFGIFLPGFLRVLALNERLGSRCCWKRW